MTDSYIISLGNKFAVFIRTENTWWDATECNPLTDGHVDENDGFLVNAKRISNEFVADLVAESEERAQRLESIESLLEEWISLRRSRSRRATKHRLALQRKEAII